MQTLAAAASRLLSWEKIDLPNGVYRISNVRWLETAPDLTGWVDCSLTPQMNAEVEAALELLGECMSGRWIGMGITINGVYHGVAWEV